MAHRRRRGPGPVRRPQRHPQEELPLRVLLAASATSRSSSSWPPATSGSQRETLFPGESFNLDFHSIPYYGEHPGRGAPLRRRCAAAASRACSPSWPRMLDGRAFCYSNADLRKGEEAEEIFRFIAFWKRAHGELPRHLVFDSKLTTYANLARLDEMGITFITLRRRSPKLKQEIALLPRLRLAHGRARRARPASTAPRGLRTARAARRGATSASCSSRTSGTTSPPSC